MQPLDSRKSYHLSRALRELTSNILHHAHADSVRLNVQDSSSGISLTLHDNGRGFEPTLAVGNGLAGIRQRLQDCGGFVQWQSQHGQGCQVTLALQLTGMSLGGA